MNEKREGVDYPLGGYLRRQRRPANWTREDPDEEFGRRVGAQPHYPISRELPARSLQLAAVESPDLVEYEAEDPAAGPAHQVGGPGRPASAVYKEHQDRQIHGRAADPHREVLPQMAPY